MINILLPVCMKYDHVCSGVSQSTFKQLSVGQGMGVSLVSFNCPSYHARCRAYGANQGMPTLQVGFLSLKYVCKCGGNEREITTHVLNELVATCACVCNADILCS